MLSARLWAPVFLLLGMVSVSSASAVRFETRRNIEYCQVNGISLLLDASAPVASNVTAPAVIIVHGGGWVRGDRRFDVEPLFEPLTRAGFAWFSINYRLATDVSQFGLAVQDVQSAVRYVRSHAAEYHVDPQQLALIGESAGGQLAAMAALQLPAKENVKAVVGFYTPTDLVSLLKNSNYVPAQIRDSVENSPWGNFILAGLNHLSPIENVRPGMPPFLLIHGTADSLVPFEQSTAMCKRMREAGASCEVYAVEGAGHGIRWWHASRSSGYEEKMTDWLRLKLGVPEKYGI